MNFNSYFPGAGQTFAFSTISIIILVVIALFALIYAWKGFVKALFGVLIAIGSIVVGAMFCKQVAAFLFNSTPAGNLIYNPLFAFIKGIKGGALDVAVTPETASTAIPAAFKEMGIPDFLAPVMASFTETVVTIPPEGASLASVLAYDVTMYALVAISFAVITAVVAIVLKIIQKLLIKLQKALKIGWIDRLLGGIIGAVIGLAICAVVSYALIFFIAMDNDIAHTISDMTHYTDNTVYTIEKGLMSFMNDIISLVLKK